MTIYLDKQPVRLADASLIASGGEGSAYKNGGEVIKVYHTPIARTFVQKMKELSPLLDSSHIIAPKKPVFDGQDQLIGYTMDRVQDPIAMSLLFTTSYLKRNGISLDDIIKMLVPFFETVHFIHKKDILIVDANEFNFLITRGSPMAVNFIDVDSYQTPSFPATAILPTIRDYTSSTFSELTDWYSIALLAFQMLVGIHPYRGKHPRFSSAEPNQPDDIAERCKAHVSILDPKVLYPKAATRSFDDIPVGYREWLRAIFEQGERLPPPLDPGKVQPRAPQTVIAISTFINLKLIDDMIGHKINDIRDIEGRAVILTDKGVFEDSKPSINIDNQRSFALIASTKETYAVFIENEEIYIFDGSNKSNTKMKAKKLFYVDDRLYAYGFGFIMQIALTNIGSRNTLISITPTRIPESSSSIMTGVVYIDMFGRPNFMIPYGFKLSTIFHSPDLDGYRIVDAFYMHQVLIVIGFKNGVYDRFTFKFTINGSGLMLADHDREMNIDPEEINATVLPNGILVEIVNNDLRLSAPSSMARRVIPHANLPTGSYLRNIGMQAVCVSDSKIFAISTR